jgi:hypothetical protein
MIISKCKFFRFWQFFLISTIYYRVQCTLLPSKLDWKFN